MKLIGVILIFFFVIETYAERLLLSHQQSVVKNQGDRDFCAYYSVIALVESALKQLTQNEYDLSEDFEFVRNKKIYPWRPEVEFGDTYRVLKNIAKDNYLISEDRKQKIQISGFEFKELTQLWVKKNWSEKVIEELKSNKSVVTTLKISLSHINDLNGVIKYNDSTDQDCQSGKIQCGGHAVLIVGFDTEAKVFLIKNSWGSKWGTKGYGVVTFEHIDKYASDFLTAGFNKMYSPSVKVIDQN